MYMLYVAAILGGCCLACQNKISYIYKLCRPREMDNYFIEHCLLTSSVGKQHTNVIYLLWYIYFILELQCHEELNFLCDMSNS